MSRAPEIDRLMNSLESDINQLSHIEAAEFTRDHITKMGILAADLRGVIRDKRPRYEKRGHPPTEAPEIIVEKAAKAYQLREQGYMWKQIADMVDEHRAAPSGNLLIRGWTITYATKKADPPLPWPVGRRGAANKKEPDA